MNILITGAAGFIGFHTCLSLCSTNSKVIAIDNINNYYDVNLKFNRLKELGFTRSKCQDFNKLKKSKKFDNLYFSRTDITDNESLISLFKENNIQVVCNLAAQAGVRYSIENPNTYIKNNIEGFLNILEACRNFNVKHLVYASSSSVYGENKKTPFSVDDTVDYPISLYAATKKSNELMAFTYGHLFGFKTTGLRFFTVYGPWGRPDMAYFLFAEAIANNQVIKVYNNGKMKRDFTYIDDIVKCVKRVIQKDYPFE